MFPTLDTFRFFAFLAVFIGHSILFLPPICSGGCFSFLREKLVIGDLGVSAFFILSGFLITILLITEQNRNNKIRIDLFYLRRILRIWPLYILIVVLGFYFIPNLIPANIFGGQYTVANTGELWRFLTFTFNFAHQYHFVHISLVLGVLWSISVEEQFYAFWPIILKFIKQSFIPYFLGLIIIFATIYRYIYAYDLGHSIVKYSTFSVMSDIAMGALFAYFYGVYRTFFESLKRHWYFIFVIASNIIVLGIILFRSFVVENRFAITIEPVVFSLAVVSILLFLPQQTTGFMTYRPLVYLGKISYGLYMYHIIAMILVLFFTRSVNISPIILVLTSFITTVLLASISYFVLEKPILSLKHKIGNPDVVSL